MNEYQGQERRKDFINMDGRLVEAEEKIDGLTTQITVLCTELPYLKAAIESLTKQIQTHESNAATRSSTITTCRDERIKLSEGIKWIWLVISVLLLINTGLLLNMLLVKK